MSASTERKKRKAAREAGTDKKTLALREEAKKKAQSKRRWTWGTIGVALLIAAILFFNSGFFFTHTTAVTVGSHSYTPAQVSYRYASQYHSFANQYGSYASIFGLDTSAGLAGLNKQSCPMLENGTWRDYFLQAAQQQLASNAALLDYAQANGITLSEEEIAQVDSSFEGMDSAVRLQGFGSVDKFFAASYGSGVNTAIVRQAELDDALASKTYQQVADSHEYSAAELEEYYQSLNGDSDVFDYAFYHVDAEKADTTDDSGNAVQRVTDETLAAAKAKADAILDAYNADVAVSDIADLTGYVSLLDAAVSGQAAEDVSTRRSNISGSNMGDYKEWLMGSRSAGDAAVIATSAGTGYDVVLFLSRSDNHYKLANVRHILITAQADENGSFTDEAKAAALAKAQEIYDEWKNGDKTEESFAALAEQYSEDSGSNTNGGLYENIYHGQMVSEFDAFCFAGHKSGDTDIVYGDNGGYAGYHIIYYVGDGEQYSDYIARNAMLTNDMTQWMTEVTEGYEATLGYGQRFVGK